MSGACDVKNFCSDKSTEDVPLVSNFPTGFTLRPSNFFVENAAMDVRAKTTDYELCAPKKPE